MSAQTPQHICNIMDIQNKQPTEEDQLLTIIARLFIATDELPSHLLTTGEALQFLKTKNPLVMISKDDLNHYLNGLDFRSEAIPNDMERLWFMELNPVL
jgi:hypothetical protein